MNIDYYKVLGVIDTADPAVIKGAYRALIQIYHPDKYRGDSAEAIRKTQQINEAYSVLSDPKKRNSYDAERVSQKSEYEPEDDAARKERVARDEILESKWSIARKYVAELDDYYDALLNLSEEIAFTFKINLIESRRFDQAKSLYQELRNQFFSRYFGSNSKIQGFARELLDARNRKAAQELNRAVNILGDSIDADQIIHKLREEFHLNTDEPPYKGPSGPIDPYAFKGGHPDGISITILTRGFYFILFILFIISAGVIFYG